jgi:hypothetical protein
VLAGFEAAFVQPEFPAELEVGFQRFAGSTDELFLQARGAPLDRLLGRALVGLQQGS